MRTGTIRIFVLVLLVGCSTHLAFAQSIMRSPNLNIPSRMPMPNMNPTLRIDPSLSESNSLRTRSGCSAAFRDSNGNCTGEPIAATNGSGRSPVSSKSRGNVVQASVNSRIVANEIVAEIDGALSDAQADALARRHGLTRAESQNFPLIGTTIGLFRITNRRTVEAASRELARDASVRTVQPNFRYVLQDQAAGLSEGDPAQYANAKLHLPQAHTLARGVNVTVAVIDSGIDIAHPEFAGSMIESFDALGSKEGPHVHGTGIAGAIVSHARLMGSAPAARILAIRAFGAASKGAESTSYVILKGFEYAASHGAQIVNMSFAGPKDRLIERGLAALAAKDIVQVAAVGNAGPKSPPLYPAADAHVIAVSATDAQDKLFAASNRGGFIAVAAPGVDIFLPAPGEKYQMITGTSFSAAYVSGLAALMLERNPALRPNEVRTILTKTARDLGPPGPDDQFGAGEADAFAAVAAVPVPEPVAEAVAKPVVKDATDAPAAATDRALSLPAKDAAIGDNPPPEKAELKPAGR